MKLIEYLLLQSRRYILSLPVSYSLSYSSTCRYGSRVFEYLAEDQENRLHLPNPLCTVFPTVTRWVVGLAVVWRQRQKQWQWHYVEWCDGKDKHFPLSCTFHSVGTAAGEQKFNSICILSLNIINEKVIAIAIANHHIMVMVIPQLPLPLP